MEPFLVYEGEPVDCYSNIVITDTVLLIYNIVSNISCGFLCKIKNALFVDIFTSLPL